MKGKIMSAREAVGLIKDGDTVAITSAGMVGYPEYMSKALLECFLETGSPKNLTISAGCGHGLPFDSRLGDSKLGVPGLLKRYIGSHPDVVPPVRAMIFNNEIEGYALPQGILNQLYRCAAAKQAGVLSKIGMGTYIDPRQEGGRLNGISKESLVEFMEIQGEEWLFYKSYPINVAIIRATTADESGNLTIEQEALKLEILEAALAAKASKGTVIAQVKRVAADKSLRPKDVVVPGNIVDAVVVAEEPEENHRQTKGTLYSPHLSGELRRPSGGAARPKPVLAADDVICRRAVFELWPGAVVNIGVGIGAGIGDVADSEGIRDRITFTLELGTFGGVPTPLSDFGAAVNAEAYIAHPSMFDYYHGGGLDITFLGTAQVDRAGNVNVSKFGNRPAGQGGFIDISQTSGKVVFVTYFTAKGFESEIGGGRLNIVKEGQIQKFVDRVEQITFNGAMAAKEGKEAVYVTERAVFRLTGEGLVLTEIAPGADLENDVLRNMGFTPIISGDLKVMDPRIFTPGRMGAFD
ncbi:MAG: acyl CoA:acetate/3-ketoacid CoA transferase [Clostridiales Family XIII bacterium]|nr:acyl CoA:acetate/3-ketoacid CoA transferase [Clostridiales Family XIII bacterium]